MYYDRKGTETDLNGEPLVTREVTVGKDNRVAIIADLHLTPKFDESILQLFDWLMRNNDLIIIAGDFFENRQYSFEDVAETWLPYLQGLVNHGETNCEILQIFGDHDPKSSYWNGPLVDSPYWKSADRVYLIDSQGEPTAQIEHQPPVDSILDRLPNIPFRDQISTRYERRRVRKDGLAGLDALSSTFHDRIEDWLSRASLPEGLSLIASGHTHGTTMRTFQNGHKRVYANPGQLRFYNEHGGHHINFIPGVGIDIQHTYSNGQEVINNGAVYADP